MSLEKIVSIPGMSGLYKVIAQLRNGGFVIESLADQKRIPVDAMHKMIKLEDVSIYTTEGEIPLKKVFLKMKENDADASKLSSKSEPVELKAALKKFVPDYDEDRVHTSDIRKMVTWYSLLKEIVDFKEHEVAEVKEETPASNQTAIAEATAATAATAKPKTKTPKAKKTEDADSGEEKPVAKKRAAKKSAS